MALTLFQLASPNPVRMRIGLEPVFNALNSLALLNLVDTLPALNGWVRSTAAAMTPAERHTNRLIFEGLSAALISGVTETDFAAYLDALTTRHPEALRDAVLAQLIDKNAPVPAELLADNQAYVAQLKQVSAGAPVDEALQTEAHALLNDPFKMHDLIITHLRTLWEAGLATEWARTQRQLENSVGVLQHSHPGSGLAPEQIMERLETFVGRPAGFDNTQELVFVPSQHTGHYTTQLRLGTTRWLFFDAILNYWVLLRESPVGEAELIGRLSALTESMRLRILTLLAQHHELTPQEIMEQLGQSQPNVSRYLKSLSMYVHERRGRDGKKHYRLSPAQLDLTFYALKDMVLGAGQPAAEPQLEQQANPEGVGRWLNAQGVVNAWPGRERDRLAVLEYVAECFAPGQEYTEKEVNALITQQVRPHVRDHVTIRRDLVDYQFLCRASDGSRYWRNTERAEQS
jgi:DNA-binding MarR family transcriptional regulator